jgi:hypothetical protein
MFLGFLLALHIEKCIAHWEYYEEGANVFQKEKEKEKETETRRRRGGVPLKGGRHEIPRKQGAKLVSAGARGECSTQPVLHRIIGLKLFGQIQQNQSWQMIWPLMEAI